MPRGTDRYDEARHQGRLWTPQALRAKMALWHDYSDLNTVAASGTQITSVTDKSGNGRTGTPQAVGGRDPGFQIAGWKSVSRNRPAIICTAAQIDNMEFTGITYSGAAGLSVHFVMNNTAAAGVRTLISGTTGAFELAIDANQKITPTRTSQAVIATSTAALATGYGQVGMDCATNRCDMWLNGALEATANNGAFTANAVRYGCQGQVGSNCWDSYIGEALVFTTILSLAETYKVTGCNAWKWGAVDKLPASHPFKNRPPLIGD